MKMPNTSIPKSDRTRENFYRDAQIKFMNDRYITNLELRFLPLEEKRKLQIEFEKWCNNL